MKHLMLILIIAFLSACGKGNDSGSANSLIKAEILFSPQNVDKDITIVGSGICGYKALYGRIYLDFCEPRTQAPNLLIEVSDSTGLDINYTVTERHIDMTIQYGGLPIHPMYMNGSVKVREL